MTASLVADHRASDGHLFPAAIAEHLQHPEQLFRHHGSAGLIEVIDGLRMLLV
jgi:hypothetical protein